MGVFLPVVLLPVYYGLFLTSLILQACFQRNFELKKGIAHPYKSTIIRGVTKYEILLAIDRKVVFFNSKNICFYQLPL